MECHRCSHAAEVRDGRWRGVRWERTPCSRCELVQSSAGTKEYKDNMAIDEGAPKPWEFEEAPESEKEEMLPLAVMAQAVAGLMSMDSLTREVVCQRYMGKRYRLIAEAHGVSTAAAEHRHARALVRWPALREMFAAKWAKQERKS